MCQKGSHAALNGNGSAVLRVCSENMFHVAQVCSKPGTLRLGNVRSELGLNGCSGKFADDQCISPRPLNDNGGFEHHRVLFLLLSAAEPGLNPDGCGRLPEDFDLTVPDSCSLRCRFFCIALCKKCVEGRPEGEARLEGSPCTLNGVGRTVVQAEVKQAGAHVSSVRDNHLLVWNGVRHVRRECKDWDAANLLHFICEQSEVGTLVVELLEPWSASNFANAGTERARPPNSPFVLNLPNFFVFLFIVQGGDVCNCFTLEQVRAVVVDEVQERAPV